MILNQCKKLYSFYLEVAHVINSLESMGKAYRNGRHREYYFENVEFYRSVLNHTPFQRTMYLPKITRDLAVLRRGKRVLEVNKHDLMVFSTLGTNVGDPHFNIGLAYK